MKETKLIVLWGKGWSVGKSKSVNYAAHKKPASPAFGGSSFFFLFFFFPTYLESRHTHAYVYRIDS
jgi:hypothetical protein